MPTVYLMRSRSGIVTSDLVADYRFDTGSGQVLRDYSGNGNHGQLGSTSGSDTNDPSWISAGLQFGIDDWVDLTAVGGLSSDKTIQTLIRFDSLAAQNLIIGNRPATGTLGWFFRANIDGSLFAAHIGSGGPQSSAGTVTTNTWYIITWVVDVGVASAIYRNETSVASQSIANAAGTTSEPVRLSHTESGPTHGVNTQASILIYDRALSAAEILANVAVLRARAESRGLTLS